MTTPSQSLGRAPRTIAVLHMNQVGDLVFSLPALAALRAGFPEARIVSVVRESLEPVLSSSDLVDEVLVHRGSKGFVGTANRLRELDADLAVALSESPRTRMLSYLSRAPMRVGLGGGPLASLLTESVEKVGLPSTANNLRVIRALGCPVPTTSYVGLLGVTGEDRARAGALLGEGGLEVGRERLVVLAPGASRGREHKEWPLAHFLEVARDVGQGSGTRAIIVGAGEPEAGGSNEAGGWIDLRGRTDLAQLVGLLTLADAFVGNDSGVLHLAAALSVPSVALFGPTNPAETGPHGAGHIVLQADQTSGRSMASIAPDDVLAALEGLLAATPGD